MKTLVTAVFLTVALASGSPLEASDALKAIVSSYLEIQEQLVADRTDGLKAPAQSIVAQAPSLGDPGREIEKAAKTLEQATDLKAAREAFGALSEAVIAAGKAEGWKDAGDIRVGFCPMVKRSWIQKDEKVQNPYYGKSMLSCGELKRVQ